MAQALHDGEREVWREHLEREAFANQARELRLVLQRVDRRNDSPGTMAQQEERQRSLARLRERDQRVDVIEVILDLLDVKALPVGLAATVQVECVYGEALSDELFRRPLVVPAMRLDAVDDGDHAACRPVRHPGPHEDVESRATLDPFFPDRASDYLRHENLLVPFRGYA